MESPSRERKGDKYFTMQILRKQYIRTRDEFIIVMSRSRVPDRLCNYSALVAKDPCLPWMRMILRKSFRGKVLTRQGILLGRFLDRLLRIRLPE